jgi:hypothetical protein
LETSTPITTPIVRESQVGSLLKMFWLVLGFMMIAFANPKGAEAAMRGEVLNKGVRFSVRSRLDVPSELPFGLMVVV